ncbi:MAG: response regulator [Planctomycetes bacterium]|nr:response regulator [Planctomycetota bacterium]
MLGKVLIADDSRLSRRLVKHCLTESGVEVNEYQEAADGLEALKMIQGTAFDVVFTDLNMPNLDGLQLIKGIDFNSPMAPRFTVVISSVASQAIADELMENGAAAVISKPITSDTVGSLLRQLGYSWDKA